MDLCGDIVERNTPFYGLCQIVRLILKHVISETRNTLLYSRSSVEKPRAVPDKQYLKVTVFTDNYCTD